jgi:rhodanese-related sulfurtransferase
MINILRKFVTQNSIVCTSQLTAGILVLCCALSSLSWADDAPRDIKGAKSVDCYSLLDLIATTPGVVIIDNRTQADFEGGHIEGAIRILDTEMTRELLAGAVKSKETPVVFYCNGVKCGRAAQATIKALEWGYANVYYYTEGMLDWKTNRLPIVTQ